MVARIGIYGFVMAFLRLVTKSFETAGHGIATGATTLADEVTGRQVAELRNAREEQERHMRAAARGVDENARIVGNDINRVLGTTGVSVLVLSQIVTNPDQLMRLVKLIETHDFMALVRALRPGVDLPADFFPAWIRRAGGYFPKFAQVLSVRADLIHSREVLEQLGHCIEDMPAFPVGAVRQHLLNLGWDPRISDGVGESLNAGTVAQVNVVVMPNGQTAVVKVAWPETRRQMETDFRLFAHARRILAALRLEDEVAKGIAAMFSAVGRNETNVLREFDMQAEASALDVAGSLCSRGGEWDVAYLVWLEEAPALLSDASPLIAVLATQFAQQQLQSSWHVKVPHPVRPHVADSAFVMSRAGGESLHRLLADGDQAAQQEAVKVIVGFAVPFIGWLLLCRSSSHLAHVDPHLGNFRWDTNSRTLWVLDWGSNITVTNERRRALCLLIVLIAGNADDESVADTARSFGIRSENDAQLARLMRDMMNASVHRAAQDAINSAAIDGILDDVGDDVVPVVRCLATLGGILKEIQRRVSDGHHGNINLSLARLWSPFATIGLTD